MTRTNPFPIQCLSCGATGEVLRVTANLQCRCGSTDLDLWDGTKEAASGQGYHTWLTQGHWPEEHEEEPHDNGEVQLPDHLVHSYDTGYNRGLAGHPPLGGFFGDHQDAHDLGYQHGARDLGYTHSRAGVPFTPFRDSRLNPQAHEEYAKAYLRTGAAHGPGTGWGQSRPDSASNWSDYAGPTPGLNPKLKEKLDSDDSHTCPICHGTGKAQFGGGGYSEGTCRNCHGTGKVVYPTENDTPSLDAHMPNGPELGSGSHGHYSSKTASGFSDHHVTRYVNWAKHNGHDPDEVGTLKKYEKTPNVGRTHADFIADQLYVGGGDKDWRKSAKVAVPGMKSNKVVTSSQADKIMAMASTIVESNSGLSTQEAFELARRAVVAFPEDQD